MPFKRFYKQNYTQTEKREPESEHEFQVLVPGSQSKVWNRSGCQFKVYNS